MYHIVLTENAKLILFVAPYRYFCFGLLFFFLHHSKFVNHAILKYILLCSQIKTCFELWFFCQVDELP